jgi:hypothetical protein
MRQHERSAGEVEDVELDEVDSVLDGGTDGTQGVLGREACCSAMADPENGASVAAP